MKIEDDLDVSLPRTQERVEAYLESVLDDISSLEVQRGSDHWTVRTTEQDGTIPYCSLETRLQTAANGEIQLVAPPESLSSGDAEGEWSEDLDQDEYPLTATSEFVESLLQEEVGRQPLGHWELTGEPQSPPEPEWLANSPVSVTDHSFAPYYDRRAMVVLFEVSVETVSEFEHDILVPEAIDCDTSDRVPSLGAWYSSTVTQPSNEESLGYRKVSDDVDIDIGEVLDEARRRVHRRIQPSIEELRDRAIRAAEVEFQNYVELQEDRIDELRAERDQLEERLNELGDEIESADERSNELDLLDRRQSIKAELEECRTELENLQDERTEGFPKKQQSIRSRHEIEVTYTATHVTLIDYEKGDLKLTLSDGGTESILRVPYGLGVGVTDDPTCESCGAVLTSENPLSLEDEAVVGENCC